MLRLTFVFLIIALGCFASLYGPFYALLFYLWNAYFRPEYWVWSDMLIGARLSLVIGLFLLAASVPRLGNFKWNGLILLLVLFLGQATLALLTSNYYAQGFPYWVEFFKVVVICLLVTVLVDDVPKFRLTLHVIAWSLAFEAAKQGWAQLVRNPGGANPNTNPMLGDNNGVALGMMMLVPLLTALAQTSKARLERYLHYFVGIGVVYRGISTYSRGGFLAGAAMFLLILWRSEHKIRTLIVTASVVTALLSVMPDQFWDRMNTITAEEEERDGSALSRLYFWQVGQRMANDNPLTGVGFNSFRFAFSRYDASGEAFGVERSVHSIWYGTMSELGYPGLCLFVLVMVSALVSCQGIRRRASQAGMREIALFASALQTSIIVYAVGGTFLNAQYLELWWHLVALTIALGFVCTRELAAQQPAGSRTTAPAMVESRMTRPRVASRTALTRGTLH